MSDQPLVVLLSGASCSCKTTIATELQRLLSSPYNPVLHIEADRLIPRTPQLWPPTNSERRRAFSRALHRSIAAYANERFDLIVDGALPYGDPAGLEDALLLYGRYRLIYVGVHCELVELERREKERTDRKQGWARQQFQDLHDGAEYDVQVNTTNSSAPDCAKLISDFLLENQ